LKKILILDFDGTIIDSNLSKQDAIQNYIKKKYNIDIFKKIDKFKFRNLTRYEIIEIAKNKPISNLEKFEIDEEINKSVINSNLDPYFFELFKFCKERKIKMILVSNTPEESLKEVICKLKMFDYFYKIIGQKDNNDKIKIFSEIIQTELVRPSEILSVGDNINDYFASRVNNIPFHGLYNYSFLNLSKNVPISYKLIGIIKSLR